jgi:hypothetical protein
MIAFKIYKFVSVDEAIYILMRDPETKKYNHRFMQRETRENNYEKVNQNECLLCYDEISQHANFELDLDSHLDVNMGRRSDENKDTTVNGTSNNLIKSTDHSGIADKLNQDSEKKIIKFQQIDIPQETLDLFENPEVCTICFGEAAVGNNKAQFSCGHKFCKTCVSSHLNININNGKVNFIQFF